MNRRWGRLLAPTVLAVEAIAVVSGRIGVGTAAGVFVAVEVVATMAVVLVALRGAYAARGPVLHRLEEGLAGVLPPVAARLIVGEFRLLRSFVLAVRGRLDTESADDVVIGYAAGRLALPILFLALAAGELVAVHVAVPWHALGRAAFLKWVSLALSGYGMVWMICWMLSERTHPHLATATDLVLRRGPWVVARIPWASIRAATPTTRFSRDETRLTLDGPMCPTTLDLEVDGEVAEAGILRRTSRARHGVSLAVDDAAGAAALITARLRG